MPFLPHTLPIIGATVQKIDIERDVAVLLLPAEPDRARLPHPFVPLVEAADGAPSMPEIYTHRYRAYGFPLGNPNGVWTYGKVLDDISDGTVQLEGEGSTGKTVQRGFSGGPVYDDTLFGFIGLMVRAEDAKAERISYMIPLTILKEVVPDLHTAPSKQDEAAIALHQYLQQAEQELAERIEEELEAKFVQLTLMLSQSVGRYAAPSTDKNDRFEELADLITRRPSPIYILLGAPGSGKSVLLERLRLQTAREAIADQTHQIPFLVRLSRYKGDQLTPLTWLKGEWESWYAKTAAQLPFETLLQDGKLLLLLDGLNEIPHADQTEYDDKVAGWSEFLARHLGRNRAIFTCRTLDYSAHLEASERLKLQQVQVEPLSPEKIHTFLTKHAAGRADAAWETIRQDRRLVELYAIPFFLKLLINQLETTGTVPRGRAALITGYIRDSLFHELIRRKTQALRQGPLLLAYDREQIQHKAWGVDRYRLPTQGQLIPALTELAYRMQDGMGRDGGLVSVPKLEIENFIPAELSQEIVSVGCQLNLLIEEFGNEGIHVRFVHQLYQEYFAARKLKEAPEPERVTVEHRAAHISPTYLEEIEKLESGQPVRTLPTTGWEETLILAAGMMDDPAPLIETLIGLNLPLAGRCALSAEVELPPELHKQVIDRLLERLTAEVYDVRGRMQAGLVLGDLGDPRFERHEGDHGCYILPPFVAVPGGAYTVGDDNGLFDDEKPAHRVPLEPFEIAVYPVTNAEYRCFIEAGGYENEAWWDTPAALAWLRGESTAEGGRRTWKDNRALLKRNSEEDIMQNFSGTMEDKKGWITIRNWER